MTVVIGFLVIFIGLWIIWNQKKLFSSILKDGKTKDIQNKQSSSPDIINRIQVSVNNREVVFQKVDSSILSNEKYQKLNILSSSITATTTQLSPILIQGLKGGLYEATVSPSVLASFQNGLTSTMIQDSQGRIVAHAGFSPVLLKTISPLLAFQTLSYFTAQHYLSIIQSDLKRIISDISVLKRFAKHDKIAQLESVYEMLQELYLIQNPQIEHLVLLEKMKLELGRLCRYYINEIKHFGRAQIEDKSCFTVKSKLKDLKSNLYQDDFPFQVQMFVTSKEIEQMLRVVSFYLNCKYINTDNASTRASYIEELVTHILKKDFNSTAIIEQIKEEINAYYDNFLNKIQQDKAWFETGKEKQKAFIFQIENDREKLLSRKNSEFVKKFQSFLKEFWHKEQKIYLHLEDEYPAIFVEK